MSAPFAGSMDDQDKASITCHASQIKCGDENRAGINSVVGNGDQAKREITKADRCRPRPPADVGGERREVDLVASGNNPSRLGGIAVTAPAGGDRAVGLICAQALTSPLLSSSRLENRLVRLPELPSKLTAVALSASLTCSLPSLPVSFRLIRAFRSSLLMHGLRNSSSSQALPASAGREPVANKRARANAAVVALVELMIRTFF